MRSRFLYCVIAAAVLVVTGPLRPGAQARLVAAGESALAPEFTHTAPDDWLNSPPLTLESLRGKVVLLDFWTFACWNCYRSFP